MELLKNNKWTVVIDACSIKNKNYNWVAWAGDTSICHSCELKTKAGCKKNFEKFAKLNGIKDYAFEE